MNREIHLKQISDVLAILSCKIGNSNTLNLYDINIIAEDFFKGLLNLLYNYKLSNLNITEKNTATIDLADKDKRIAIQVTSSNTSTKIHETLNAFISRELYRDYDRLVVLITTNKKNYIEGQFDGKGVFTFDQDNDIIDVKDLLKHIRSLETLKLEQIATYLEQELDIKGIKIKRNESNEVETIIKLIEFLSNRVNTGIQHEEKEPDPDFKIYKRFADHSDFITNQYQELVSLYGWMLKEAERILGLDSVRVFKIGLFLKDISDRYLTEYNGNPKQALNALTDYFNDKISHSGIRYDAIAIKFYLIDEIIRCNVFPNK